MSQALGMTQPLALLFYEKLMPGSQLANRLKDLGYRVQVVEALKDLVSHAERARPLVVVMDLSVEKTDVCPIIRQLRRHAATSHIPILAFATQANAKIHEAARAAGATLVAMDNAIVPQLPQLLNQVLELD